MADLYRLGLVDKATTREFGCSESGNTPASAALKLLSLVKAKGLDAIR